VRRGEYNWQLEFGSRVGPWTVIEEVNTYWEERSVMGWGIRAKGYRTNGVRMCF